ncbi:MAG: 5-formyltetrahydrofolate cyclo-ligase [Ruminococcus sp.]|jgi:5,10-methenyltetrahydrofolate synthetase|nr:5-formyltetrahydrofolate cyclo-ligase [Ruminococcus sp.]
MLKLQNDLSKAEIRKICLDIRNSIEASEHEDYTKSIWNKLYEMPVYVNSNCVLTYASFGSEPSTIFLITRALSDGKRVYCPRILDDNMEFVRVKSISDLKPSGKYNIPEPQKTAYDEIFDNSSDYNSICIMPALSVDRYGTRLGYGKGYYDKYLYAINRNKTVGNDKFVLICGIFSSLLTEKLPKYTHDILVDIIITEEEVLKPKELYRKVFI